MVSVPTLLFRVTNVSVPTEEKRVESVSVVLETNLGERVSVAMEHILGTTDIVETLLVFALGMGSVITPTDLVGLLERLRNAFISLEVKSLASIHLGSCLPLIQENTLMKALRISKFDV